ncbi:MAG: hypothetical protein ACJ77A_03045 [Actinomycetota bacterium]
MPSSSEPTCTITGDGAIYGTPQADVICGGSGDDTIYGGWGDDIIRAGPGSDHVYGDPGFDELWGGPGDDYLDGGNGIENPEINGWADRVVYSEASGPVNADLTAGLATGEGTDELVGIESVIGSPYGDVLKGAPMNGWVVGGGGDDQVLDSTGEDDSTDLGGGNDRFVPSAGDGWNMVWGGEGIDSIDYSSLPFGMWVQPGAAARRGWNDYHDDFWSIEEVTGSEFDDVFYGDVAANRYDGKGGNDVLIGGPGLPTETPDVLFESTADGDPDIYIINETSGFMRKMTKNDVVDRDASWGTEGGMIYFSSNRDGDFELFRDGKLGILPGEGLEKLTSNGSNEWEPTLSPDGRTLAFASDRSGSSEVYTKDLWTGATRRLTHNSSRETGLGWAPGGRRLVFAMRSGGQSDIYTISSDGREIRAITRTSLDESDPTWSPTSGSISFASDRAGNFDIYTLRLSTGDVRRLTRNRYDDVSPAWDASGKRIMFTRRSSSGSALYVADDDATTLVRIPFADGLDPEWGQLEVPFTPEGTCGDCADDVGDVLLGGAGEDSIYGGSGDDLVDTGPGSDVVVGDLGNDTLVAGSGNDRLIAGPGAGVDSLFGEDGDDHLYARDGAGDDSIDGGDGVSDGCFADPQDVVIACP